MSIENLILIGALLLLLFVTGVIIFVVIQQKRSIRFQKEKVRQDKIQEILLSEAIIKSQEKERKIIGEDLHDDIAPSFAAALMNLNSQIDLNKGQDVTYAKNAVKYIENGIKKIRDASHLLHPAALENFGFLHGLEDFCIIMNSSKGCQIEIHTTLENLSIDTFKQLLLFRLTQEIVFNALKHGNAKVFKISIYEESNELNLIVFNNGDRFMMQDFLKGLQNAEALGLKNIQHRLNLLRGIIKFNSNEDQTEQSVHIQIPLS